MGLLLVAATGRAEAQLDNAPSEPPSVALVGFDALGMDQERVLRLETLFLKELERLTQKRVPGRRAVSRLSRRLRRCNGNNRCLSAIGRALKVDVVISGNVAALGDAYVLNVKGVKAEGGEELRRIESPPLHGKPDELIEAIRVAAYRLLSPDELVGSISVLADREGAIVELDSKVIGKTPLEQPISGLALGTHELRVSAGEFGQFESEVRVRFQKTTRVVVNLVDLRVKGDGQSQGAAPAIAVRDRPKSWYQKPWFLISAGVGAALLGGYIGYSLSDDPVIKCSDDPARCMP